VSKRREDRRPSKAPAPTGGQMVFMYTLDRVVYFLRWPTIIVMTGLFLADPLRDVVHDLAGKSTSVTFALSLALGWGALATLWAIGITIRFRIVKRGAEHSDATVADIRATMGLKAEKS